MAKIWAIARATYRQRIWSGTFLILTFGLPILMIVAGAIPIIQELGGEIGAIGIVDRSGSLSQVSRIQIDSQEFEVHFFEDDSLARQAWGEERVDGFAVIPEDYISNPSIEYFSDQAPGAAVRMGISEVLRRGLLPGQPEAFYQRLSDPASFEYLNISRDQQLSEGLELILKVAAPIGIAMMFAITVMTGASQIGQAVAQEKDQRSMEMIITSVSARELISGKLLGMTLLTLTQIGIWIVSGVLILTLAFWNRFATGQISIPWQGLVWGMALTIPGYFLFAVLAAGLGVLAGDRQQAQQLAGMLGFIGLFPVWFMAPIIQAPSGPIAIGLTIFPLTSPIVGLFRLGISEVPAWQLYAGLASMVVSIGLGILLVARVFRTAMLLYGQRLGPKEIFQAVRRA